MQNSSIADTIPENIEKELSEYSELLRQLLFNRGITTKEEAEKFLNPSYEEDLHDPAKMLGMESVVERILKAIEKEEKIVVYADYDCDGIPGAVILNDFFEKIGYENFEVYIPDRHEEGYGLHKHAVEKFGDDGVKLLITIDLGITAVEPVSQANKLGIDVIITDHHLPGPQLPPAYAILNPKQEGDEYPFKDLCGAGIVFKLIQALLKKIQEGPSTRSATRSSLRAPSRGNGSSGDSPSILSELGIVPPTAVPAGWEKWLLDMAGLATLSDMVPLRGENRALAYFGLKVFRKNRRPGLQKLIQNLYINKHNLTEDDISFMITPRLNAASRMDSPRKAFDLLSTKDESEADILSNHLTEINDKRKTLVSQVLRDVKRTITRREEKEVIVIGNPKWRLGILGLVASRLVEEYKCPAFVWCKENGCIKGSCRSDGSVNLVEMMRETKNGALLDFGGHEFSGGFSVSDQQVHFLEDELVRVYRACAIEKKKNRETEKQKMIIDKNLSLEDVVMGNYELIKKLGPFGVENQKPNFLFEGVEIIGVKRFGKDKNHLEISFKKEDRSLVKAISFFKQPDSFPASAKASEDSGIILEPGLRINLIANIEKNTFRYRTELRLRIVDIFV